MTVASSMGGGAVPAGEGEAAQSQEAGAGNEVENQGQPQGLQVTYKDETFNVGSQFVTEEGKLNEGALYKAYADTKAQYDKVANARAPESYEFKAPEGFAEKITAEDPMVQWAMNHGKEAGWTQEMLDQNMGGFLKAQAEYQAQVDQVETQALGVLYGEGNVEARKKEVSDWVTSATINNEAIPEEERAPLQAILHQLSNTAAGVRVLDRIRSGDFSKHIQETDIPGAEGRTAQSDLTDEKIRTMMKDPRYWKEQDPKYVEEVRAAWKKLYPGQHQTSV